VNTLARNPRFRELLQRIGRSVHERDEHTKRKDRRNATKAAKQLDVSYGEIGLPLYHHLKPLKQRFIAGDAKTIDEVLDFLVIDLFASGTGYQKQWYYRKLEQLDLPEEQVNRVREIALARYASNEYRREDSELRRLMVRLADAKFMEQVRAIPARSGSSVFVHKDRMLDVILAHRKDLGDQLKTKQGSKR
jgi:hypothetical protein